MTRLTLYKLALAAIGLFVFFYGVEAHSTALRWVGIGLVALALLLRFLGEPPSKKP